MSMRGSENSSPHCEARRAILDDADGMQQGLGGNASPVETDAAGVFLLTDQNDRQTEIGGHECGRISAGTGPQDHQGLIRHRVAH